MPESDQSIAENQRMTDPAWTDEALRSAKQDTLGRQPYARQAAELLNNTHTFDSSAVFGLSGPWGSGKTSLVNMVVEELLARHPDWAVARFTPWATSDISGLVGEFYSSLADVLPQKRSRQLRRALAVTAIVAAPAANLIPVAGGAAAKAVEVTGKALQKSPSWEVAFNTASKELRKLQMPILVVVDDIDRLHGDELLTLLKVVRLLGRFDGVSYLLAYDDETLYRSMTLSGAVTAHDGSAERFMEKIVQYPLFVPPLLRHQQLSRLNSGLTSSSREISESGPSSQRLVGLIDCFTDLLRTPRAIDRYVAQLQHHIPLLPTGEVDDVDVQLLTLIRVSFPSLFNSLPRFRSELVSGHTGELRTGTGSIGYEPFNVEVLLGTVPVDHHRTARKLLVALFPNVREKGRYSLNSSIRRQSVHHDDYFDRYFAMSILDYDVSDADVRVAVSAATAGDSRALRRLLVGTHSDFRGLVLSKCVAPTNQPTSDEERLKLARAVAGIINELPTDDSGPFSQTEQALDWFCDLMLGLTNEAPSEEVRVVFWQFTSPALRARAWMRFEAKIDDADRPLWQDDVRSAVADDSVKDFVNHLEQGDGAKTEHGVGYQLEIGIRYREQRLRAAIHELIGAEKADISILASRLVKVWGTVGVKPEWQLSPDFEQDTFDLLAPPGGNAWYEKTVQDVDPRDISWSNRRNFAVGRVSPPPPPPPPPSQSDEVSGEAVQK